MKVKFVYICILVISLVGCSFQQKKPYIATEADFDSYFDSQIIVVNPGVVTHPEYGTVPYSDERYQSDDKACLEKTFSGQSFKFGSREISDPMVMRQMTYDNSFLFFQAMIGSRSSGSNDPKNNLFEDKAVLNEMNRSLPLESKSIDCVKEKGWKYPSSKK